MLLVIDNHDSFTWNLVHLLARHADDVEVLQADALTLDEVVARAPRGIVLSPGSGHPAQAALPRAIVRAGLEVPLLGVCLGHQVICAALGARVVHATRALHGRTSRVTHDGLGVFEGLPNPLEVARYHSLVVEPASLPAQLVATAFSEQGELMGVRHRTLPIEGVQFHPESFMTAHGDAIAARFLERCAVGRARTAATR